MCSNQLCRLVATVGTACQVLLPVAVIIKNSISLSLSVVLQQHIQNKKCVALSPSNRTRFSKSTQRMSTVIDRHTYVHKHSKETNKRRYIQHSLHHKYIIHQNQEEPRSEEL